MSGAGFDRTQGAAEEPSELRLVAVDTHVGSRLRPESHRVPDQRRHDFDYCSVRRVSCAKPVIGFLFAVHFTSKKRRKSGCGDPREEKVRDVSLRSDL